MDVVAVVIVDLKAKTYLIYRDVNRSMFDRKVNLFKKDDFEVKVFCGQTRNTNANSYINATKKQGYKPCL